jgi:GDP-4-dehydro-6-deoxy-D-mannose reductase
MGTTLVTGVNGFLGRHVAISAAAIGEHVVGLDRVGVSNPVDILAPDQLAAALDRAKPDVVIHLAGALRSPDVRVLYDVNAGGTAVLLDAISHVQLRPRVVVVSSSAVYGAPLDDAPLTEESALRPVTHYGASKVSQEVVALRAFHASQLPVMIVRPFNIVGPGQPSSLAAGAFAEQIAKAELSVDGIMHVGNLAGARDFIDVRDVATACLAVARSGQPGVTYNVSSERLVTLKTCVDTLLSFAKVPIEVRTDASRVQANDARAQVGSAVRLKRDTGWSPTKSFEQSMHDLLTACRETLGTAS